MFGEKGKKPFNIGCPNTEHQVSEFLEHSALTLFHLTLFPLTSAEAFVYSTEQKITLKMFIFELQLTDCKSPWENFH